MSSLQSTISLPSAHPVRPSSRQSTGNLSAPRALHGAVAFVYDQLKFLDGRSVLVRPEDFHSQNSVGKRGSLQVVQDESAPGGFRLEIALEVPEMSDMGGEHGHTDRILIPPEDIEPMLLTEFNGAFTYTPSQPGGPRRTAG